MVQGRKGFGAAAVGENRIVVAGGHNDETKEDLRSAEMLVVPCEADTKETKENRCKKIVSKKLPRMNLPRNGCAAVSVGARVIVVGGMNSQRGVLNTGEMLILHGQETEWQPLQGPMKEKRLHCAAVAKNNKIYVIGGTKNCMNSLSTMESYDLQTRSWSVMPPMLTGRIAPAACIVDRKIYVIGGYNAGKELDSVECYDIDHRVWSDLANVALPNPIAEASVAVLPNSSHMVIVGGTSCGEPSNRIYNCEIASDDASPFKWSSDIPVLPTPRSGHAMVAFHTNILVLGGFDGKASSSSVETITYTVTSTKAEERYPKSPDNGVTPKCPPPIPKRPSPFSFTRPLSGKMKFACVPLNQEVVTNSFYVDALADGEASNHMVSIKSRLQNLVSAIQDHFQYKVFYTMVSYYFTLGELKEKERNHLVKQALKACSKLCDTDFNYALFRIHLDKAFQDNAISKIVKYELEGAGNKEHIRNADFIQQMQALVVHNMEQLEELQSDIQDIYASLSKLESNVKKVNESLSNIATGLRRKYRIEACAGFVGALLNAISFGVAGSAMQGCISLALSEIVNFGDVPHLCQVVEGVGDISVHDALQTGLDIVEENSEMGLMHAVREKNSFVIISAVAAVVSKASGQQSQFRFDSYLDPVEEKKLPIHAAINNNHPLCFMSAISATDAEFNQVDSKFRSPADFAAVHGRVDMMNVIVERGGRFNLRSEPAMRKYAERRALEEQKKKWELDYGNKKGKSDKDSSDKCIIS